MNSSVTEIVSIIHVWTIRIISSSNFCNALRNTHIHTFYPSFRNA